MGTAPPPPPAIKIGDVVLDRYRVVEQIASGGHSVVFRGLDERLSRPVCIKVFSGLGGKSGVGRTSYEHFVQEAFALSRLTHPNTLRIFDFGHLGAKDEEGMPLQVCEYMNGGTLSQVIREEGKQTLAETVRVIAAMCAALSEAHGLGIVHRDIKPQNILFGTVGVNRLPKLADFGIAKWSADDDAGDASQRAEDTAIVAGQKLAMYSPSWAAPEQLAGQPVSAATDIYSLAVVAVYMLTGKAIFADEDVYAGYKKRRQADDLVPHELAPLHLPRAAVALLTRALAFDPKKRLDRVDLLSSELAASLEAVEPSEPPRLPPIAEPPASLHAAIAPTLPGPHPVAAASAGPAPSAYPVLHGVPAAAVPGAPPPAVYPAAASPYPVMSAAPYPTPLAVQYAQAQPEPPAAAPPHAAAPHAAPPVKVWQPPVVRPPWMMLAPVPTGVAHRLPLSDAPQQVGDRAVHFVLAAGPVDLTGSQAQKVRISFLDAQGGVRMIHIKGMTCFVAHLGGRPSPAVQLDQPSDIALVTPRAQEIGHIRVATGALEGTARVFAVGNERIAVGTDDCTDPILFDFGPGSDAYFVYTRGRAVPRSRRR